MPTPLPCRALTPSHLLVPVPALSTLAWTGLSPPLLLTLPLYLDCELHCTPAAPACCLLLSMVKPVPTKSSSFPIGPGVYSVLHTAAAFSIGQPLAVGSTTVATLLFGPMVAAPSRRPVRVSSRNAHHNPVASALAVRISWAETSPHSMPMSRNTTSATVVSFVGIRSTPSRRNTRPQEQPS